jgi:uncharacterized protein (UPF0371 family)
MSTKTRIAAFMVCLLLAMPMMALADEAGELRKKIIFDQKKLVVMQNMEFTEEEKTAFWPVYQKFQEELFPLNQRTVELVLAYASVFQSLTNDQAAKIVEEYLTIQDSRQAVMRRYFNKFMKILPAKKVFRYLQIENKMDAVGRYELAQEIPLAK